ncbi:helix-turn-helix domain-containing protein [Marinomonas algicola]|uniref:helix-turn-helix domain-containing protein n=1 Tax=Marinomonas algicola TaxID=2773454 RepID=UPI00174E16B2|nr:helix-turn-helix domain-containing protein [Marinomonas algicola]
MNTDFSSDALTDGDGAGIDIGNELKTRRLHLNLTQGQISDQLKIPQSQIQALENNRFDMFRSPVFARGYLKSYLRALGLNEAGFLMHFDSLQESKKTVLKPINKVKKQAHLTDPIVLLISVVLVAVLVFLVFWWPTMSTDDESLDAVIEEQLPTETAVIPEEGELLIPSTDSQFNDAVDASEEKAPFNNDVTERSEVNDVKEDNDIVTGLSAETKALLKDAGVSVDAVALETQSLSKNTELADVTQDAVDTQTDEAPVNFNDDLVIKFNLDCWTEVRNPSGKILYSGIKKGGSTLTLSDSSSYRVVLGYAPGVSELLYKGKAFDFTSFIRKDLARFELK